MKLFESVKNIFGFNLKPNKEFEKKNQKLVRLDPTSDDNSIILHGAPISQVYGYQNFDGKIKNENDLIRQYRDMSHIPEIETAVDEIINESIIHDLNSKSVHLNIENVENVSDEIKKKIYEEYDNIYDLLNFNYNGYELFRRYYIDGRLFIHKIIDENKPKEGIQEIENIDPLKIKKVKEYKDESKNGGIIERKTQEYYQFNPLGFENKFVENNKTKNITKESICEIHSGLLSPDRSLIYSFLHKAIKPLNQLRMIEDAIVIYRIARAPERRVFYIDVGNLQTKKAEEYLNHIMNKHRNKTAYDINTGEVKDDKHFTTIMEDYWMPRREGSRGTEIDTLQGGQNLGEIADIEYFQKKLYKSLNIPYTRLLESEQTISLGRSNEITRDELKFHKFIQRIRKRFSQLFLELLKTQLLLKEVITYEEWEKIKPDILFTYEQDNYFNDLKKQELIQDKLALLRDAQEYMGKYFSKSWIQKNILRFSEEEIKEMEKEINDEIKSGKIPDPNAEPQGRF